MANKKTRKPKETEHISIGTSDPIRRQMLLTNANLGVGKVSQVKGNVVMRVGNETYGYIIYTILNAKLDNHEHNS